MLHLSWSDDLPTRAIDQHPVQSGLDPGQLQGDLLPEVAVAEEVIGTDTTDCPLCLLHQGILIVLLTIGSRATRIAR
jgi:hypothetical protein